MFLRFSTLGRILCDVGSLASTGLLWLASYVHHLSDVAATFDRIRKSCLSTLLCVNSKILVTRPGKDFYPSPDFWGHRWYNSWEKFENPNIYLSLSLPLSVSIHPSIHLIIYLSISPSEMVWSTREVLKIIISQTEWPTFLIYGIINNLEFFLVPIRKDKDLDIYTHREMYHDVPLHGGCLF